MGGLSGVGRPISGRLTSELAVWAGGMKLSGYPLSLLGEREVASLFSVHCPQLLSPPGESGTTFWYHTCKPCYPGRGWRRQLCSAHDPGLGEPLALGWVGESLYPEAEPQALHPFFATNTRSPAHYHERAPYGVCGLLASPKHSPDAWGQSCKLSALARCVGMGFLLLRRACSGLNTGGNAG